MSAPKRKDVLSPTRPAVAPGHQGEPRVSSRSFPPNSLTLMKARSSSGGQLPYVKAFKGTGSPRLDFKFVGTLRAQSHRQVHFNLTLQALC